MDRSVLEGNPHSVVEGMIIAAYAIGAGNGPVEGYVYVRHEYPFAVERLRYALDQARERNLLGKDILGSGFDFDIRINQGAGAFVCGESTALTLSIEGSRGMPRGKHIRTVFRGLWGQPTNLNNVESYANVPWIINHGAEAFASVGTPTSKGTKIFSLTGKVANGGLIEVPMGATLREVIFEIGGGMLPGREFKAVQLGGPSGGCLPGSLLDEPIDFESLVAAGSMMGSGGMVVVDDTTCMVDFAKFFLKFTAEESCGKCVPCRVGTTRMLEILERISAGTASLDDVELLEQLADDVVEGSLCALGGSAPNPVLSTLRYFRDEVMAHVVERRCPAKVCRPLIRYRVDKTACTGCRACLTACPSGAVSGERKEPHHIDQKLCTKCDACRQACRFDAVRVETGILTPAGRRAR
jgi:NADH-quinone oxidoreductase subunit F